MTAQPQPGQRVKLEVSPVARQRIYAGLSWDPIFAEAKKGLIFNRNAEAPTADLDLTCYIFNTDGSVRGRVTADAQGMIAEDHKIYHSGDDPDGMGDNDPDQDDERLYVELRDLSEDLGHIVFMVSSKNDFTLTDVPGIVVRIVDSKTEQDLLKQFIDPEEAANRFNYAFAAVHRAGDEWLLSNLHEFLDDLSVGDMEDKLRELAVR